MRKEIHDLTHAQLVARAARWLRGTCKCLWVLNESKAGYVYTETADVIGWDRRGMSHLVECKVSRADFTRDKHKEFRRIPSLGMGSFRYYMIPAEIEEKIEVPERWGLLVLRNDRVFVAKKPEMQPRNADVEISLVLHQDLQKMATNWCEPD
jgi:hypothetical protein